MNYKDVELMDRAFGQLGDTLLRSRQLAEQKSERKSESDYRTALLNERLASESEKSGLLAAKNKDERQAKISRIAQDTANMFGKWVADGVMQPDKATAGLKKAMGDMKTQSAGLLDGDPVVATALDPSFEFQKPDEKTNPEIEPKEKTFTGPDGKTISTLYNPHTGAFHVLEDGKEKKDATITWPIGPTDSAGRQPGRITGSVSDPSVRSMMGTNAPPIIPRGTPAAAKVGSSGGVPPPAQRAIGQVYSLPKGQFQWTAAGWVPAAAAGQ